MRSRHPTASALGAQLIRVAFYSAFAVFASAGANAESAADRNSIAIGADPVPAPPPIVPAKPVAVHAVAPKPAPKPRQAIITIGAPESPRSLPAPIVPPTLPAAWPVAISLKETLREWALRANWPAPQFLTESDWPVDVPSAIPGPIEAAIKALPQGFSRAPSRPRIEVTENKVILVTETNP